MDHADFINIDFEHSPTVYNALMSTAGVAGVIGPVGSGKSHGCSGWILAHASMQPIQADGYKRSRYAVIRNTAPELKSTTIKTFEGIFPPGPHGRIVYSSPITYRIKFPPRGKHAGMDCEIIFLALDSSQDVRKLLSLELTGAWVNEARETVAPVIDALGGRIGRYPAPGLGPDGEPVRVFHPQIIMDSNAPDEDSWMYDRFELNNIPQKFTTSDGREINLSWELFKQPPAVLELREIDNNVYRSVEPGYEWDFDEKELIRAANKIYGINPQAENLPNLDPAYYARQIVRADLKYIEVMCQAKYGFYQTGKPVVPEFNHDLQVTEFPVIKEKALQIGIDIGGGTLQPAAIIGQTHDVGTRLAHSECIGTDMGVDTFATVLKMHLDEFYPGMEIEACYLDPAAEKRDEIFENKVMEYLRAKGFPCRAAPTNDPRIRRQAIADPCGRLIMGRPGLLIHKRCKKLINGLKGKWDFRKLKVTGMDTYSEVPSKNEYSHPCDALGYWMCGAGEAQPMKSARTPSQKKAMASGGFVVKQDFEL